ncbi:MAG TPA: hypothetical protein VGE39_13310, partial [Prosthecobacter sp.]
SMATHTCSKVAFSKFSSVRGRGNASYSFPLFQKVQNEYDILFENQSSFPAPILFFEKKPIDSFLRTV